MKLRVDLSFISREEQEAFTYDLILHCFFFPNYKFVRILISTCIQVIFMLMMNLCFFFLEIYNLYIGFWHEHGF